MKMKPVHKNTRMLYCNTCGEFYLRECKCDAHPQYLERCSKLDDERLKGYDGGDVLFTIIMLFGLGYLFILIMASL